ncbi:hypothetical protein K438DRAFT_1764532 [Mycena galopus ATCC 62051]|nr:hypothetical protein K438DRAFT_1764532 [Mycena galopus ATCC 62051]
MDHDADDREDGVSPDDEHYEFNPGKRGREWKTGTLLPIKRQAPQSNNIQHRRQRLHRRLRSRSPSPLASSGASGPSYKWYSSHVRMPPSSVDIDTCGKLRRQRAQRATKTIESDPYDGKISLQAAIQGRRCRNRIAREEGVLWLIDLSTPKSKGRRKDSSAWKARPKQRPRQDGTKIIQPQIECRIFDLGGYRTGTGPIPKGSQKQNVAYSPGIKLVLVFYFFPAGTLKFNVMKWMTSLPLYPLATQQFMHTDRPPDPERSQG